jgi:cell fate regulator YaaT (PSP1 superfamily)
MDNSSAPRVVGLRFSKVGKIYHFDAASLDSIRVKDSVVVETSRGWQIGEVAQILETPPSPPDGGWKSVERIASPRDLLLRQLWQLREYDVVEACKKRAADIRVQNMKVAAAEYSFDGTRLTILYSSEGEEKVDLKSLRSDMQKQFSPAQVELRQIGPRDVAKLIGGMGACGLENRCCSQFLTDFSSISIRMAKEQNISLTPTEITGMCGRLRCCLIYEFETYSEARKGLPKRGKRMATPAGEGRVIDVQPLQGIVRVDIPEVGVREFTREEIAKFSEPPAGMSAVESGAELGGEDVEEPTATAEERPAARPQQPPRRNQPPNKGGQNGQPANRPPRHQQNANRPPKPAQTDDQSSSAEPETAEGTPQPAKNKSRRSGNRGGRRRNANPRS